MNDIHYTKKDFKIEWYSGTGAGGQHRNKHQNCCRITHLESNLVENGTMYKSRIANQKIAFERLAKKIVNWLSVKQDKNINEEVIRNYNESRNEVHDKASGLKLTYKDIVVAGNLGEMIDARHETMKLRGNKDE